MQVDILVVGSGGGGLVAALTAAAAGRKVLVIEKLPTLGGSTAISGGLIWIPNNSVMREAGEDDSFEQAWTYVDGLVGDVGPATSPARKKAYLTDGPQMTDFLRSEGLQFSYSGGWPDYYASRPGGRARGRAIESVVFDGKKIGKDFARMNRRALVPSLAAYGRELAGLSNGFRRWHDTLTTLRAAGRTLGGKLRGKALLTMGMGLVAQLLYALQQHKVDVWSDAPLQRLLTGADGRVSGVVVRHLGREITIEAAHGVVLAAGGFAHNAAMRATHQPLVSDDWSHSSRGDEGDGIRAGIAVNAATAQMEEAWWMPTFIAPDGQRHVCSSERTKPFSIIVDSAGERFANEAGSYMEIGQRIFRRQQERGGALPCWLVFEARHRRYYPFITWPPGYTPRAAFDSGFMVRANTLEELAQHCGIDSAGLRQTVARYNRMCATGRDDDFHRGDDPYDSYFADPGITPNATMGAIEQAPFYAVALYPGDLGTNGGLLCDEHARVLRADGAPIAGLYATGNCTASVMGHTYPGPGATIGPSMTFGYIAARHAAAAQPG